MIEQIPGKAPEPDNQLCPHLGRSEDKDTAIRYPSEFNRCYAVEKAFQPVISHQDDYCLAGKYISCPVLLHGSSAPESLAVIRREKIEHRKTRRFSTPAILLVVLAIAGLAIVLAGNGLNMAGWSLNSLFTAPTDTPVASGIPVSEAMPTFKVDHTSTPTDMAVTATYTLPVPVVRTTEVSFGSNPALLIHVINVGESFANIAQNYDTSLQAIRAVNTTPLDKFQVGSFIIIPVGTEEISGQVPALGVYQVGMTDTEVRTLANELAMEVEILCRYNGLKPDDIVKSGSLLVVPGYRP